MASNRYSRLLEAALTPEAFVRMGLGVLEAGFREMALWALADWGRRGIVSEEMFSAVASLQRPSWGMWNGLLSALRNARKATLRAGDAGQRGALEQARVLDLVLGMMDRGVDGRLVAGLKALGEMTRTAVGAKLKMGAVLAMPIGLRNRVAHDTPTDAGWWEQAAAALRPLMEFHAVEDPMGLKGVAGEWPSPWFLEERGEVLAFNGIERDFAVLYVNDAGVSRAAPERTQEVLLAFQRLLGKVDEQEKDFKKLLSRLAPEEIKGVMMGDWLVGHPVGEGGFATVHVGRQLSTGRKVAMKILHDGMEPETIARFQQEASFLSRFRHPNIVDVYGFGQETWSTPRAFSLSGEAWFEAFSKSAPVKTFIALEWIEGRTLDEVFRAAAKDPAEKPSLRTLAQWMGASANALSAVHAAGLIHRDIKPHNLMVTTGGFAAEGGQAEGQIKLMDFGIARVQKAERTLVTESGRALGTPAYMSPEQIRAADAEGEVGPGSDVYSLAATFYELVTGQRLYRHDTATLEEVKTMKISGRRPVRPKVVVKGLPWEIETILLGGLEPEAADRYRTMEALERDLRHFLADEPIEYKQPSLLRRTQLVYRRNRAVSNLVALFLVLAVAGVVTYIQSIRAERNRTAVQRDLAIRNEGLASAREKDARLRLSEVLSSNGHALLEKGDPAGALLWYVRALPLLADAPARDRMERLRIGMTLRQLPRPIGMWNYKLEPLQTVYAAEFSADGRRVATGEAWIMKGNSSLADARGGARVLDARTGEAVSPAIEHEKIVTGVSFSHDGSRLVTLSGGAARVYEVSSGKLLMPAVVDEASIARAEFSADGRLLLAVGGAGKKLRIIDIAKGEPLYPEMTFEVPLAFVMFSADGTKFLAAVRPGDHSGEGTIRVHDVATGKAISAPVVTPSLWGVAFSPDNHSFAVASGEGWARVYDSATGQAVTGLLSHSGVVTQIAFSRDGKQIATASADKTARVWSVATGKAISAPMRHDESPFALGFNDDGTRLATFAYDKTVRVWDAKSGYLVSPPLRQAGEIQDGIFVKGAADQITVVTQSGAVLWDLGRSADPGVMHLEIDGDATRAAISKDSKRIAVNSSKGTVHVLDAATGRAIVPPLVHPQPVTDLMFSPDGRQLVTASRDGARIWDVSTTQPAGYAPVMLKHEGAVNSARFSPDGKWVVTASADKTGRVWDAATGGAVSAVLQHDGAVNDAAFSPDGQTAATASADHTSRLWDAATGSATTKPMNSGSGASQVRFSPDGNLLLVPDDSGHIRLWNPRTGKPVARAEYGSGTREASFSSDGTQMLAAGFSNWVKLYDTKSPESPTVVLPSGQFSAFACFAPGGDFVYTASFNGSRLWDTSGLPIGAALLLSPLRYGAFSPDGRWLVTVDSSRVRTWDVTPEDRSAGELEKFARLLSGRSMDGRGVIAPLGAEEAMLLFEELRGRYPEEFSSRLADGK
jgi:WD40 repeat protein/serine/threonine protein kinase